LFRLDAEAEILFKGAEPVPLGRRAVALLRALVVRRGRRSDLVKLRLDRLRRLAIVGLTAKPPFAQLGDDRASRG
jgi:hypothetical protein